MSDKHELKAELERKKQRLAQIREEKKRKEEERKKKEAEQKQELAHDESTLDKKRRETDALLQSFGIPAEASIGSAQDLPTASKVLSTPSEAGSQESVETVSAGRMLQWDSDPNVLQLIADSDAGRRGVKLGVGKITQVDVPPKEVVSYCKETQTPGTNDQTQGQDDENEEEEEEMVKVKHPVEQESSKMEVREESGEGQLRELSEEEKQQVMHSDEFLFFFDRSTRIIERALAEDTDIFLDYSGRNTDEKEGEILAGTKLSLQRHFFDEHWTKHRVVTFLDWSPQHPELLVTSYTNNEAAPHEPDGVALIWNMKFKKSTPEYIFHCQSPVLSACFAHFHPNLVVGGTYSGQIVLWDNRTNKRTPVQRTPLSALAHTHPVYCVSVVGTQNANNLISISTDGKMCSWSLDMLSQPQDSMELFHRQAKTVAVTCMAFPLGDVNNFVVGSEEGAVYTASRHGSKAGISEAFEGHQGPVTGLSCHTAAGSLDFSHLFVSSSFDWTVKLWSTKSNKPLYSFEDNSDYIYDVAWSPCHPALFACVDGMGRLDLWNLNSDTEVPTASVVLDGAPALNRVRWAQSGRELAVGDAEGHVWIYDVGEQVAVPRSDEWGCFARTLSEIRANRADTEDETLPWVKSSPV